MGNLISGAAELALYTSIRDYIYARIEYLTEHVLSKNLTLALIIIISLLTVWVMIQGFMIATGRSQEGLKGFAFNLGKTYFIVAMALGVASSSGFALRTLTDTLADGMSEIMRGDSKAGSACLTKSTDSFVGCKIDQNLTMTQSLMGLMNRIDTVEGDETIAQQINQAKWFAGVGSAGPGVVAGTMLIVFRITMALFIGFGPIFILCLLFKKTAPLFQRWLHYGLATMFAGVTLGVMADIATDLVSNVSYALFFGKEAFSWVGVNVNGLMDMATQQLGLGIILSTLLITVPPLAGAFFNGLAGSASGYNVFSGFDKSDKKNQVNPNVDGGASYQSTGGQNSAGANLQKPVSSITNQARNVWLSNSNTQSTDALKSSSSTNPLNPTK
ncbi:MAG: type IV secretion system protein [Neisseria sp.]|uniref:type IV secretion system protein n=1 Tax=Neisseria sp. TaxID=192066 RepID=UPI0026DC499F|nr:type IV secretion system protein [Neisseria sp.]MDO4640693.1 type IV secretion system protein [Neisseria sp.]